MLFWKMDNIIFQLSRQMILHSKCDSSVFLIGGEEEEENGQGQERQSQEEN